MPLPLEAGHSQIGYTVRTSVLLRSAIKPGRLAHTAAAQATECPWPRSGHITSSQTAGVCAGEVDLLPWSEMSSVMTETHTIAPQLVALNAKGFLTINSQPRVNGAPSDDPHVGWGGQHGCLPCWAGLACCLQRGRAHAPSLG